MKLRKLVIAISVSMLSLPAGAAILTFDDLNTGGAGSVATSYAGFTFNGWWHIDMPPYSYPFASSPTVIYNSESPYTNTSEILFGSSVNVLSAYFADYNSGTVTLHGYLGATELFTTTVSPNNWSMTQYSLGFMGIDRFVMEVNSGTWAFMDNLEVTAVPEPETYAMLLTGLGLLGFMTRRRKESTAV